METTLKNTLAAAEKEKHGIMFSIPFILAVCLYAM
jgi:hypothetical protein